MIKQEKNIFLSIFLWLFLHCSAENNEQEVTYKMKRKNNPSKAAVSAASVKGSAGPGGERQHGINKVNSQNNQFKK
ncbi:hypothetical protein AS888_19865 [Peribacillus simplex]|uniref:Uncharacterized protein n=1 Tax=Peribacillus simplex TaxID=1478 RepID=A0A120GPH7_9BACI|nr:hypothetical protein AS888_19865 [Peribacillus simplex]